MDKIIVKSKDNSKIIKIRFEGTPIVMNLENESISTIVSVDDIEPINCGFSQM